MILSTRYFFLLIFIFFIYSIYVCLTYFIMFNAYRTIHSIDQSYYKYYFLADL